MIANLSCPVPPAALVDGRQDKVRSGSADRMTDGSAGDCRNVTLGQPDNRIHYTIHDNRQRVV